MPEGLDDRECLDTTGADPRRASALALLETCRDPGPIVVYHAQFERCDQKNSRGTSRICAPHCTYSVGGVLAFGNTSLTLMSLVDIQDNFSLTAMALT